MKDVTVAVAATNAAGIPDFYITDVGVTDMDYTDGVHYDVAKDYARKHGFEGDMVAFDNYDAPELIAFLQGSDGEHLTIRLPRDVAERHAERLETELRAHGHGHESSDESVVLSAIRWAEREAPV